MPARRLVLWTLFLAGGILIRASHGPLRWSGSRLATMPGRRLPWSRARGGMEFTAPPSHAACRAVSCGAATGKYAEARTMIRIARVAVLSGVLLVFFPLLASADCGDDCQSAYRNCLSVSDSRSCSVQLSTCTQTCVFHSERHGAIAYSESKRTYGYSYDYDRSADAKRAAVKYCRDSVKGGASDCRVVISFWNACGAIPRTAATARTGAPPRRRRRPRR